MSSERTFKVCREVIVSNTTGSTERSCKVCGDKANGYNFGVLSCESCKAFFRRNAAKVKDIKCPFSDSCGITSASRRFCQACRLKKCFAVGMSSDWLHDQNRKRRREIKKSSGNVCIPRNIFSELVKKAENKCKCSCTCGFYPEGTSLIADTEILQDNGMPAYQDNNAETCIKTVPYTIPFVTRIVSSIQNLNNQQGHEQYISTISQFPINDNQLKIATCSDIPKIPSISQLPTQKSNFGKYSKLPQAEIMLLEELARVSEPLKNPLEMQFGEQQLSLMDVVRITVTALRRIICMARDLQAFSVLSLDDKKILMKGCCSELLILRGVMAYDVQKKMWSHPFAQGIRGMEIKLDVLKDEDSQHYEKHKRFLESFDDRVRKTESVILVLMAILIFEPERHKLRESKKIEEMQKKYICLLQSVLECEFGIESSLSMFERLLSNLKELRQLNLGLVNIFFGFDSSQLDPLLKELFDM